MMYFIALTLNTIGAFLFSVGISEEESKWFKIAFFFYSVFTYLAFYCVRHA